MKGFVAFLFLLLCCTPLIYGQKTLFGKTTDKSNPADCAAKVHVSASRLKTECANGLCSNILYANTILNGKKIELSGVAITVRKTLMLIAPGDYTAKLGNDVHNSDGTLFNQEYFLLLPGNIIWHCYTTQISE